MANSARLPHDSQYKSVKVEGALAPAPSSRSHHIEEARPLLRVAARPAGRAVRKPVIANHGEKGYSTVRAGCAHLKKLWRDIGIAPSFPLFWSEIKFAHATHCIRTSTGFVKHAALVILLCSAGLSAQPTTSIPRQSQFGHMAWQAPGASLPASGAMIGEVRGITSTPPELFMWMGAGAGWVSLGGSGGSGSVGPQGPAGPAGAAATVSVGTVSTGAPGSSATVTNAGTSSAAVFNFAIPRGDVGATGATGPAGPQGATGAAGATGAQGPAGEEGPQGPAGETGATGAPGAAATVAAGSTTTGLPGTSASVTNVGTSSAAIFNFTIPRGDAGAAGADGEDGAPGADGEDGAAGAQGPAGDDGIPRTIQDEAVDLTQRLKVNFTGAGVTCVDNAGQTRTDCTIAGGGVTDHGALTGFADDDHPQYALLAGRSGGQTITGGTAASNKLVLRPNSADSTSYVEIQNGAGGAVIMGFRNTQIEPYKNMVGQASGNSPEVRFAGIPTATDPSFRPAGGDVDTGIGWAGSDQLSLVAGAAEITRFSRASAVSRTTDNGQAADTPQAATCADSGNGSPGALTINPTTAMVLVTVSDADGCAFTLGETNVASGVRVELIIVAGSGTFSDTPGVTELAGSFVAGQNDALTLRYVTDRWVETGRSDN